MINEKQNDIQDQVPQYKIYYNCSFFLWFTAVMNQAWFARLGQSFVCQRCKTLYVRNECKSVDEAIVENVFLACNIKPFGFSVRYWGHGY